MARPRPRPGHGRGRPDTARRGPSPQPSGTAGGRPRPEPGPRRRRSSRDSRRGTAPRACSNRPVSSLSRSRCSNGGSGIVTPPRRPWPSTSSPASVRYRRPPPARGAAGPGRPPGRPCRAASPGSVSTRRSAAAMAGGSPCGTTRPVPPPSSSTAWGNPVAITGLPGGQRLDQHAGGDLLAGVVGQDHDVGLRPRSGPGREIDRYRSSNSTMWPTPPAAARAMSDVPVGLALPLHHLRMRLARRRGSGAPGSRSRSSASASTTHSMPFPGPSRPQVRMVGGPRATAAGRRRPVVRRAVGDEAHPVRVDLVAVEAAGAGRWGSW